MPASPDPRPRTVVMLQYTGIGDLIWHIPYFKAIAEQSQAGRITLVSQLSTMSRPFLAHEPWVENIIDHDHRPRRSENRKGQHAGLRGMWRMGRMLKAGHFDRIVLFSGRPSRGLVAAFSGIPQRLGFGYNPLQRIFLNRPPYIGQYKGPSLAVYPEATSFAIAHGFCKEPLVPRIEPPAEWVERMNARLAPLPRPLHAFAIGTSETYKQWGAQNFADLAQALVRRGAGVMLLGGPAERELAQDIWQRIPEALRSAVHVVTDVPVLGSAAALRVADVCVGNDTGMVNVSAAVGTPTYVLIGPRPTLDHDPLMHMLRGRNINLISVSDVVLALGTLGSIARPPAQNS